MLRIRLRRTGQRHQPYYRIVVAEHTAPVKGKFIESLGHYNPRDKELVVKNEEATAWLNNGAQPSNTVAKLLLKSGLTHKLLVIHTFPERPAKKAQAAATEAAPTPGQEPKEEPAEEVKPAEETPSA